MNRAIILALIAGATLPLQATINGRLARSLESSIWAGAVSGAVTTVALVLIGLATGAGLPRGVGSAGLPIWSWTGGLCGALALTAMTTTVPRLGAATMISMVITGQALFSVVIDQYGLLGTASSPITLRRIVAVGLLTAGALLLSERSST